MGVVNQGNQTKTFEFKSEARSPLFNIVNDSLIPTGVYSGGLLERVNDTQVRVYPLVCFIKDISDVNSNISLRIQTGVSYVVSDVDPNKPYIALKFTWAESENNWMDIVALNPSELFDDESTIKKGYILLGKANYSVLTMLTTFDYTLRGTSSLKDLDDRYRSFYVKPYNDKNQRKVYIYPGKAYINGVYVDYPGGTYPSVGTIPNTTNGRIDYVIITPAGQAALIQGVDSITPVDPPVPTTGMVIAKITRTGASDLIEGRHITQVRPDRTSNTGTNIPDYSFTGNVVVEGNLTVNGTQFITNTETVEVEDNIMLLNKGLVSAPPSTLTSGFKINRGPGYTPAYLIWDEQTSTFKIGVSLNSEETLGNAGVLQKVATREDTPSNQGIAFWNNTDKRLDTSGNFTFLPGSNVLTLLNGNATFNNSTVQLVSGSTLTVHGLTTFNNTVTISNPVELMYKTETLDTRFIQKSSGPDQVMNNHLNFISTKGVKIYMDTGDGTHTTTYDGTQIFLEQAFVRKRTVGALATESIDVNLTLINNRTLTYKGDELDVRYLNSNQVSSGQVYTTAESFYGNMTFYGSLTITNAVGPGGGPGGAGSLTVHNGATITGGLQSLIVGTDNTLTYGGFNVPRASGMGSTWTGLKAQRSQEAESINNGPSWMTFSWADDFPTQPTYVWASNSSGNARLRPIGSLSVNYANTTGYSSAAANLSGSIELIYAQWTGAHAYIRCATHQTRVNYADAAGVGYHITHDSSDPGGGVGRISLMSNAANTRIYVKNYLGGWAAWAPYTGNAGWGAI